MFEVIFIATQRFPIRLCLQDIRNQYVHDLDLISRLDQGQK